MSMESLFEYCSQQPRPSTTPLLPRLFTFDEDGEGSLSVECGPLELELDPELGGIFKGCELDDDAAATAAAFADAALSTLFKNGLGKFSSAKSYSGKG